MKQGEYDKPDSLLMDIEENGVREQIHAQNKKGASWKDIVRISRKCTGGTQKECFLEVAKWMAEPWAPQSKKATGDRLF